MKVLFLLLCLLLCGCSHTEPAPTESTAPATLENCRQYAAALAQQYGIGIRMGDEALTFQPWDYTLEPENSPQVLMAELEGLEAALSRYPQTVLEQTKAHFSSLTISLVQSITGASHGESLTTATGIQFLDGQDACVVIAVGDYSQQALYHELYHVMETHIFPNSTALDQWDLWNPSGFSYSFSPIPPEGWDAYLSGGAQAFLDHYSMTYPKEDRARIFEYAMLPGAAQLFRTEAMQGKLTATCQALRQAYGLTEADAPLPWEQYLND